MMVEQTWANTLPGVPDVESPFFENVFARKGGSNEWRDIAHRLNRDGYVVFDFPDPEFEQLAEQIKRDLKFRYDFAGWKKRAHTTGESLREQDAWKWSDPVRRIATNPQMLALLQYLYGRPAFPFQTLNFPVGTQQHFHSDSVHFSSIPERFMCGVWVALEDIDEDNGPLLYYPGSHKLPIFTNDQIGYFAEDPMKTMQTVYEPMWRDLMRAQGYKEERFKARKGQALIWAANLLHGGSRHDNVDRTRWSQVTHYYFENCAYYTPMLSDPMFGRIMFREPYNILTGANMENHYLGRPVPKKFIKETKPGIVRGGKEPDFDPKLYLLANPDVAAAGVDPLEHYRKHGMAEGRRLRPE
ncbi:MAG: phytanoyl-CoA dioxygenase family protein [Pseudomonadota bacterium]